MKNFKKLNFLLILALFIVPVLLLTACNEVNYYTIEVRYSSSRGDVAPKSREKYAEGKEIALTATEINGEFICWVKDSNKIVSIENPYKISASSSTAGIYTGVFSEASPSQMMYCALTSLAITIPGVNQFNVSVTATPSNTIADEHVQLLYQGSATNQMADVFNGNVFSFLNENMYLINVEISYNFAGSEEPIVVTIKDIHLNQSDFTEQVYTLRDKESNGKITMNFEKLNKNLVTRLNG